MWDYRARVERVIDGDTVVAYLDKGEEDYSRMTVRLQDVWCPERGQPGYEECKAFTQSWVDAHTGEWPVVVTTARIADDEHEDMSFARYVATIAANSGDSADMGDCLNTAIEAFRVAQGYGPGETTPKPHPAHHRKAPQ